jgi:hypothetical protein
MTAAELTRALALAVAAVGVLLAVAAAGTLITGWRVRRR